MGLYAVELMAWTGAVLYCCKLGGHELQEKLVWHGGCSDSRRWWSCVVGEQLLVVISRRHYRDRLSRLSTQDS
ncbi:hypothetical protein C5167_036875 [Papaver somniferum]|uniref:Uncharacterized protein n=1 Tax=Papaver somniferum TaxID=3469 RepID=A0A4Y7I956_PAPSO|nr:hypothetical protein C5167_036875 [Papaver somniferum]